MECVFSEISRSVFVDMTGNVKAQYDEEQHFGAKVLRWWWHL
jgi:hypothetical protein